MHGISPIDVTNKGNIVATQSVAISQGLSGDCTINNSGTIASANLGIGFSTTQGSGIHTIVNSGSIIALTAINNLSASGIERVTNSGQIVGTSTLAAATTASPTPATVTGVVDLGGGIGIVDFGDGNDKFTNGGVVSAFVDLGDGNDVFTNFAKVKVKGKLVQKDGFVTEQIDLGSGNDMFHRRQQGRDW